MYIVYIKNVIHDLESSVILINKNSQLNIYFSTS